MEFTNAVKKRHSVRQFTDQTVDKNTIEEIVRLAQRAPSWVNSQPWQVYCATGDTLARIKAAFHQQDQLGNHGQPDLAVMGRNDWDKTSQANMKQWRHEIVHHFANFEEAHEKMTAASDTLYNSPVILFITIPQATPDWSILDAGAFAQTLMLAAADKGLATIPTYNSVRFPEILHKLLGVPADERFMIGISLGHEASTTINNYHSKRRPVDEVLHFN